MYKTAALLVALVLVRSAHAQSSTIVGSPIDLTASVHEAFIPGGTVFDDANTVTGALTDPKQSAEYLYFPSKGENLSGRSTNITGAFASSLAESDGNGGVGVSSWIGGSAVTPGQDGVDQLVSRALWTQSFTYNGSEEASISLRLHIPDLQVGLIGVAPQRSSVSATETAQAEALLESVIMHADGSTSPGASFEFGLKAFERQLIIGPGNFSNFADVEFLGANAGTVGLFDSFTDNGDSSNPRFSLDSVFANVKLGVLQPGDTVGYAYELIAQGTTKGFEHGYVAFLGDPFGSDITSDNFVVSAEPVPEPGSWLLVLAAGGALFGVRTGASARRARARAALT
jgi:PEP-CTERM motif-containing protein